jgi:hypothetical protein
VTPPPPPPPHADSVSINTQALDAIHRFTICRPHPSF